MLVTEVLCCKKKFKMGQIAKRITAGSIELYRARTWFLSLVLKHIDQVMIDICSKGLYQGLLMKIDRWFGLKWVENE